MILFFDTETTGFANYRKASSDPSQPHLVQLAVSLTEDNGELIAEFQTVVALPENVIVPEKAAKVHGITTEYANEFGMSPSLAIRMFRVLYEMADIAVAHNAPFDEKIIQIAGARYIEGYSFFEDKRAFCTMKAATPVVKSPPTEKMRAAGRTHFKSPNLSECIRHFFDEDLDGAHDAMVDVKACERVYFELARLGKVG